MSSKKSTVLMSKQEKFFWILAYTVTAIITLLPFFQVGITNSDDCLYFNTAHKDWQYWLKDSKIFAQGAGRFYFLFTKYFYYIPYLIDNYAWTKAMQYLPLMGCLLLFAYIIYRIFKSRRLGALTFLLLIFNMSVGYESFSVPTAFPFYFPFSFFIFLSGILLFILYTEKSGYWRVLVSALLLFISFLFYENYLVFTLLFCGCILIRNWRHSGFINTLKSKSFYREMVPYIAVLVLYMVCYVGYRHYLIRTIEDLNLYDGATIAHHFSLANFFTILCNWTFYTLPCRTYWFENVQELLAENSSLLSGHHHNLFYILTHAPALAYINALLQCCILWFIIRKADFKNLSWTTIAIGVVSAMLFAFSAHILIAIAEKYNSTCAYGIHTYVTSFYSYFGMMLTLALIISASVKICSAKCVRHAVAAVWCVLLCIGAILSYYTNDLLSKEWKKTQNRITVTGLISQNSTFAKIPGNALIYSPDVPISEDSYEVLARRYTHYYYHFAFNREELLQQRSEFPDNELYFIQTAESKKQGELLMAFLHISHLDTCDISSAKADEADIYYYSPTKDFVLFYDVNAGTDSAQTKAVTVFSANKHQKITHVNIKEPGLSPHGFSISNMIIPTNDTILLPWNSNNK